MQMPRFAAVRSLVLGLAAALLVACGGSQAAPESGADANAAAADTCTTPEVTDPNTPPACPNPDKCEWNPETKQCQIKRGIIMDDAKPPPPPPPPPES